MKKLLKSKKRFLLTLSLMFFALMVFIASLSEDGLLAVYRMENELTELKMDNERLKVNNNYLRLDIQGLKTDPAGIEKVAREKLNFVKPGELVYQMIKKPSFSKTSKDLSVPY